ncbi:MAG: hypothetical protein KAU31_06910 [Spirochaetaceae bacterium]|nr:hypothetical protein [Spirochaetaceae bacterium]
MNKQTKTVILRAKDPKNPKIGRRFGCNQPGERCGFDIETANWLIAEGHATPAYTEAEEKELAKKDTKRAKFEKSEVEALRAENAELRNEFESLRNLVLRPQGEVQ